MKRSLAESDPELAAQWHPTKNSPLLPSEVSGGSGKSVWWRCEKGHVWKARIAHRSNGAGCPFCVGKKAIPGETDLGTINPELAAQWHPTKNNGLNPCDVMPRSGRKVWWKCLKGHEWQATIHNRANGIGCPFCAGKRAIPGETDLETVNPVLAAQWHSTLNGQLHPSDVMPSSGKKVWWLCSQGHEWRATVNSRCNGSGCPYCANKKVLPGFNDFATVFPKIANQWHPTKNGSLKPDAVLPGSSKRVWWLCSKCGYEWQTPLYSRTSGCGCPRCSGHGTSFPEQAVFYYLERDCNADVRFRAKIMGVEVDVYIPELNAAVEYNGQYWHNAVEKRASDNAKLKTLRKAGIKVLYVIEPEGYVVGDASCYRLPSFSLDDLSQGIRWIESELGIDGVDIDVEADQVKIRSRYAQHCVENSLASERADLLEEWDWSENGDLDPWAIPSKSHLSVHWVCNKGHSWTETVHNRSAGNGCPYCSGRRVLKGFNDLATVRPDLAEQWQLDKNESLKPEDVTISSNKNVWWRCDKGHEWKAIVASRNTGTGCPYCANRKVLPGFNDLATVFPDIAAEWHPLENGDLEPTAVLPKSGKKIWWKCSRCGYEWQAPVARRASGGGCPRCANKARGSKRGRWVRCVETGKVYLTLTDAACVCNSSTGNISRAIKNGYTCGGFHWEYMSS